MNNHSDVTDWLTNQPNIQLTNLLTNSMEQNLFREANLSSASRETTRICGTPNLITALISACHLSLFWARSLQFRPPHPTSWRTILILSSHLCLGLPSFFFFFSGLPAKTLYAPLLPSICATCSACLILLDFITQKTLVSIDYKSSLLCNLLHTPVTLLGIVIMT